MATLRGFLGANGGATGATSHAFALTGWTTANPQPGDIIWATGTIVATGQTISQTAGSTFTFLSTGDSNSGGLTSFLAYRVMQSGDTGPTFSWGTSAHWSGFLCAFTPAAGNLISYDAKSAVKVDTSGSTSHQANSAVASGSGETSLILNACLAASNGATAITQTAPSGWTAIGLPGYGGASAQKADACGGSYATGQSGTVSPAATTFNASCEANVYQVLMAETVNPNVFFDAVSPSTSGQVTTGSPSISWTHTSGAAGALLVQLTVSSSTAWGYSFTTVTCDGTQGQLLGSQPSGQASVAAGGTFLYGWKSVPSGAHSIAATCSITPSDCLIGDGISLGNGGSFGTAVVQGSGSSMSSGASIAVATNDTSGIVVAAVANGSGGTAWTTGTSEWVNNRAGATAAGDVAGAISASNGGTVTLTWTQGTDFYAAIAVEVLLAPPPAHARGEFPPAWPPGYFPGAPAAAPGGIPFYVQPSPDGTPPLPAPSYITGIAGTGTGQYWVDQYGQPIMVKADTGWAISFNAGQSTQSNGDWHYDIQQYCAIRKSQGFNSFLFAAVGTPNNGALAQNGNTWDGVAPFTSPGVLNDPFWQRVDYTVQTAANYGLTVFLNPMFEYCIANTGGSMSTWTAANFTTYGTALAARYKNYVNLLWEFGDDYGGANDSFFDAALTALRAGGDTHLISVENLTPSTSRFDIENSTGFTWGQNNAQYQWCYGYNCSYLSVEYAYTEASPLVVTKMDGVYATGGNADPEVWWRNWAWWVLSSGSRGFLYGRNDLFPWPSNALTLITDNNTDNVYFAQYWAVFASFAGWNKLVADTGSAFVTAGRGTRANIASDTQYPFTGGNTWVTASITADKTLAVVYNPAANTQTVTCAVASLPTGWTANWVDPVTGVSSAAGAGPTYTQSAANSQGGNDWLLVFTAPSGGVNHPETLTATLIVSGAWRDQAGKMLAGSLVVTGTLQRQMARVMAAAAVVTSVLGRGITRTLTAAAVLVAGSLRRTLGRALGGTVLAAGTQHSNAGRNLTASAVVTSAVIRSPGKALGASAVLAGTLGPRVISRPMAASAAVAGVIIKALPRILSAPVTAGGSLQRQAGKALTAAASVAASAGRGCGKALGAGLAATGSVVRSPGKLLTSSAVVSSSLSRGTSRNLAGAVILAGAATFIKVRLLTLAASLAVSGVIGRQAGRILGAPGTVSGSLQNRSGKNLPGTVTASATAQRGIGRSLAASAVMTAALAAVKVRLLTFAATAAVSAVLGRQVTRPLPGAATAAGGLTRGIGRTLGAPAVLSGALATGRAYIRILAASVVLTASLTAIKVRLLTLAAAVAATSAVQRGIARVFPGSAVLSGSVQRQASRTLAPPVMVTAAQTRAAGKTLSAPVTVQGSLGRRAAKTMAAAASLGASLGRGSGRAFRAAAVLAASVNTGGGHGFAVTLQTAVVLSAGFTTAISRLARIFTAGIARLKWSDGPARLKWAAGLVRALWGSGRGRAG